MKLFILLSIIFVFLNIMDVYTTKEILKKGGVEKNPIMVKTIENFGGMWGYVKMAIALFALFCIYWLYIAGECTIAMLLIIISDVMYLIILLNNIKVLRR